MIPPRTRSALLAMGALLLGAAGTTPSTTATANPSAEATRTASQSPAQPAPDRRLHQEVMQALFGTRRNPKQRRFPGLGWSVAEDRRRAKKRRNQIRNRKAHKGRH